MKYILLLLIALLLLFTTAVAQSLRQQESASLSDKLWTPSIGTTIIVGGGALSFNPYLKSQAVGFRDALQHDCHRALHFDDYLQYLPAATPLSLKICGLESRHSLWKMALLESASYLCGAILLNTAKYTLGVERPDGNERNSFPSGHTFTAFTGAELTRLEYGKSHPWVAATAYAVAALVGFMRLYNNRHWLGDVLAGAGLGLLTPNLVYWILD